MSLSIKEVQHLAKLARLGLSQEEMEELRSQISSILEYVAQLNGVETEKVEPTAQVTGLENVLRADEVKGCQSKTIKKILAQAPQTKNNFFKVKAVFD